MGDFIDDYPLNGGWDEMFEPAGTPRPAYAALHEALQSLSADDFGGRCAARDRAFRDQGITFSLSGEERPFPLDLVPRVLVGRRSGRPSRRAWPSGCGPSRRSSPTSTAPASIFDDGIVPRRLVTTSTHFHRAAAGIEPPNGVRVHVAGIDLVRGADGDLPGPRGQPAHAVGHLLRGREPPDDGPGVPRAVRQPPGPARRQLPGRLLEALRAAAPPGVADPTVVVLTPGVYNSAYFEHAFLARQMGVELVEGRDLVCRMNIVYMRSTEGEQRVDVVYRRVDDDFLDPLQFRPDSLLGCPGILNAARAGNVTDRQRRRQRRGRRQARLHLRPRHDPLLPGRGAAPAQRPHLPPRRARPAGRTSSPGSTSWCSSRSTGRAATAWSSGPRPPTRSSAAMRDVLLANPRGWIAQEVVHLSTSPTHIGDRAAPPPRRPAARSPSTTASGVWVVPGGLTRVALPEGSLVVNSSQGGGSKDTWVLAEPGAAAGQPGATSAARISAAARPAGAERPPTPAPASPRPAAAATAAAGAAGGRRAVLSRIAESLYWIGPLRRAGRGHRPHPRRALPPPAGGPVGRRGGGLPGPARRHGRAAPEEAHVHAVRRHRRPRLRHADTALDRRGARARPARTPAAPGRPSRRRCGSASTPPTTPCPAHGGPGRRRRAPRVLQLREGAGRHPGGPGRLDHEPRRRLAVPGARPQPRAGRHDRPPAVGRLRRHRGPTEWVDDAALLLGPRGVPADVPAGRRAPPRGRVPPARPAVPPLGLPRPERGRAVPGRARAATPAGPASRTRPAASSAGPAPSSSSAGSRSWSPTCRPACALQTAAPRPATPSPAASSARPLPWSGA